MINFEPKTIPCELKQLDTQTDEIMEVQNRVSSALKILVAFFADTQLKGYFEEEDIKYHLDTIADT